MDGVDFMAETMYVSDWQQAIVTEWKKCSTCIFVNQNHLPLILKGKKVSYIFNISDTDITLPLIIYSHVWIV